MNTSAGKKKVVVPKNRTGPKAAWQGNRSRDDSRSPERPKVLGRGEGGGGGAHVRVAAQPSDRSKTQLTSAGSTRKKPTKPRRQGETRDDSDSDNSPQEYPSGDDEVIENHSPITRHKDPWEKDVVGGSKKPRRRVNLNDPNSDSESVQDGNENAQNTTKDPTKDPWYKEPLGSKIRVDMDDNEGAVGSNDQKPSRTKAKLESAIETDATLQAELNDLGFDGTDDTKRDATNDDGTDLNDLAAADEDEKSQATGKKVKKSNKASEGDSEEIDGGQLQEHEDNEENPGGKKPKKSNTQQDIDVDQEAPDQASAPANPAKKKDDEGTETDLNDLGFDEEEVEPEGMEPEEDPEAAKKKKFKFNPEPSEGLEFEVERSQNDEEKSEVKSKGRFKRLVPLQDLEVEIGIVEKINDLMNAHRQESGELKLDEATTAAIKKAAQKKLQSKIAGYALTGFKIVYSVGKAFLFTFAPDQVDAADEAMAGTLDTAVEAVEGIAEIIESALEKNETKSPGSHIAYKKPVRPGFLAKLLIDGLYAAQQAEPTRELTTEEKIEIEKTKEEDRQKANKARTNDPRFQERYPKGKMSEEETAQLKNLLRKPMDQRTDEDKKTIDGLNEKVKADNAAFLAARKKYEEPEVIMYADEAQIRARWAAQEEHARKKYFSDTRMEPTPQQLTEYFKFVDIAAHLIREETDRLEAMEAASNLLSGIARDAQEQKQETDLSEGAEKQKEFKIRKTKIGSKTVDQPGWKI